MRRCGRVARRFRFWNGSRLPDLISKLNTACSRNCGSASTRERQWSGKVQEGADAGVTVLGDTVNFAARLQSLAAPGSVFMSEATHRLLQGLVDASFSGEHTIKGKAERQKVYRLDAVRHGVTRFEAAVSRGLTAFVGREHELEVLAHGLDEARSGLRIIDLAAEPGMGKSRLLHEFRRRIGKDRAFVLSGSCSPDGQQTPFLPFIEVVRGSFRLSAGGAEKEVAQKLEIGLTSLGLDSTRNLGLLLHLLGLKVPDDALSWDGVLIGLRTRELLQETAGGTLSPLTRRYVDRRLALDRQRAGLKNLNRTISGVSA